MTFKNFDDLKAAFHEQHAEEEKRKEQQRREEQRQKFVPRSDPADVEAARKLARVSAAQKSNLNRAGKRGPAVVKPK
jgi:hypothetical protein